MLDGLLLQKDVKNGPKRPNNVQGREKTTSYLILSYLSQGRPKKQNKNKTKEKTKTLQNTSKCPSQQRKY